MLAIEDITDRREAAEIQYRRLFESAKDAIVILDAESAEVVDVNPYFTELSRNLREDVLGQRLWEIPPFRNADEAHRLVTDIASKTGLSFSSTSVMLRKNGGRKKHSGVRTSICSNSHSPPPTISRSR